MNKILYRSFIVVLALTMIFSLSCCQKKAKPVEPQPQPYQEQQVTPTPTPMPTGECMPCPMVKLAPRMASNGVVGQEFGGEIEVIPVVDAGDVIVSGYVPQGTSYVRSEPPAQIIDGKLVWRFDRVTRGTPEVIRLWLRANAEGQYVSCFTVVASPVYCDDTMIGRPAIEIEKSGPAVAMLNQEITYSIVVRNTGTATANDVMVTDQIPQGLAHSSGQSTLTFEVGTLEPGQSRNFSVTVTATQTGRFVNTAKVTSSNAGEDTAEAPTEVKAQSIDIQMTCSEMEYLRNKSNNNVVIQNTGDSPLSGIRVEAISGPNVQILDNSFSNGRAVWSIPTLEPGQRQEIPFRATSMINGRHCIRVIVTTAEGLSKETECCTQWDGIPAILLEVVDDPDPVKVGDDTLFTIYVTNQGTKEDFKIQITADFPEGIDPVATQGPDSGINASISGKQVIFDAYERLDPKQKITYTITGRGTIPGDNRLKLYLRSNFLNSNNKPPVTEEESTNIY
jgi:uncharacterized repeat protein (TIGR01451 family)